MEAGMETKREREIRICQSEVRTNGRAVKFDYDNQSWMRQDSEGVFRYVRCGHHEEHNCHCYGKAWEGLTEEQAARVAEAVR
jgi:hypothetical protein